MQNTQPPSGTTPAQASQSGAECLAGPPRPCWLSGQPRSQSRPPLRLPWAHDSCETGSACKSAQHSLGPIQSCCLLEGEGSRCALHNILSEPHSSQAPHGGRCSPDVPPPLATWAGEASCHKGRSFQPRSNPQDCPPCPLAVMPPTGCQPGLCSGTGVGLGGYFSPLSSYGGQLGEQKEFSQQHRPGTCGCLCACMRHLLGIWGGREHLGGPRQIMPSNRLGALG